MISYTACDLTMKTFRNFLVLKKVGNKSHNLAWRSSSELTFVYNFSEIESNFFGVILKLNNEQVIGLLHNFCFFV